MAKVIDLTQSDGDLVVLGRSIVLPESETDTLPQPLNGAMRFNPTLGKAQIYHAGMWNSLGDDSTTIGTTSIANDHTHAMSHILGLSVELGNKAPLVHQHDISDIPELAAALNSKAAAIHGHTVANISGLQAILDGKAASGHSHVLASKEKISACLPGNPPANFKLVWVATEAIVIPAGLPLSQIIVTTAPASNYSIGLFKNNTTNVGNIVLTPTGEKIITFTSSVNMAVGDTLTFSLPERDSLLNTVSFTIVANIPNQTIV